MEKANQAQHSRAPGKQSRSVFLVGVAIMIVILFVIGHMLAMRPITSAEDDMLSSACTHAQLVMREEWVDADTRLAERPNFIVRNRAQLLELYRLRVFVVATEAGVLNVTRVLNSLRNCNYSQRVFPIDIAVHVLGNASAMSFVPWSHGRLDFYAHRLYDNASLSVPILMADVWKPQSDFELGMLLTASAEVSPYWFQWVMSALRHYAPTSTETSIELATDKDSGTGRGRLLSPLSTTLSGLALGMPIAETTVSAVSAFFAPHPSTTSIFTASFWKAMVARAGPGTDVYAAPGNWQAFLNTSTSVPGHDEHRFLYPPLDKFGALACEETTACAIRSLNPSEVAELVNVSALVHKVQRLPEQAT
ncbi:hypothetical predicted transmembrane protein [Leishmania major strain Friedlin]|uniref:Hypothetical predicted transmembrane protein n=1 Tax=Leishmania major TaxID=5664 RepID=Q4QAS5_LEIMA|nr:hypothetical predicted transmembrane protein [Leishmania major strain Friedlin]CAG9574524.1 hypothetical_protein_-_conserved [Leishmania major strain Friedlin]CAJ04314.1 hypothetical predicted transmembrane protein [Leishmania major strain Friedlin]|eukprot:XP_001683573.1 hypothetical predicted transmembrane protein [Leishmania major strain Friedlin]